MRTSRCRASRTMAETEAQSSDRGTFPDQACRPTQQRTILFHKLNSTSALPLITTIVGANVIWNYLVILPDCQTLSRRDLFSQHVRRGFLPLIGDKDINLASSQNHRQVKSSQVKSMLLTDAGSSEPLCPYRWWNANTDFKYFQYRTQIDLRYRLGRQCNRTLRLGTSKIHSLPSVWHTAS